ncbi:DUF1552 domain-containing protein [Verrucomicrobiales bacterium]|jgi:hypothetical protein|nr:DUF1552 domain-containing protein [Verrucomicrobiales bacterium]MDB4737622.1 DUF1552 domain-containing protein [Verrucomicrobiales bacterium]MDC0049379.1 DUF1552 domain-containing protein [Verrucomicrobiota bacterium]
MKISSLDRRKFLRGAGVALALPCFESFTGLARAARKPVKRKRLACFYLPDGVPMPLKKDPSFKDWSWFPHGKGKDFTFTKCMETLEPLRNELTVFSGLSHPAVRRVHGHANADQFLTGADTGADGDYRNSISLDQVFASHAGKHTRHASLVLSTDGGTGSPRGAHTMSYNRNGRPIPAEHKPKRIFDMLFEKAGPDAAHRLALSQSALDDLMEDAQSLRRSLSKRDQETLAEYLQSVRDTEVKIERSKRWLNIPLPRVDVDHLKLDITPEDPRTFVQTMYELIYLAFKTDSTRVATYQFGRENGVGISDYLARAVGFKLTHQLSHETKKPDGYKNFGKYCRFINEELGRFANRLKETPESGGEGNMLDHTALLFGSASSAFHLSRNYPLLLIGGSKLGFKHGHFLKYGQGNETNQSTSGISSDSGWQGAMNYTELPLSNLYLTMLHKLGVETNSFGGSSETLSEV